MGLDEIGAAAPVHAFKFLFRVIERKEILNPLGGEPYYFLRLACLHGAWDPVHPDLAYVTVPVGHEAYEAAPIDRHIALALDVLPTAGRVPPPGKVAIAKGGDE